MQEEKTSQNRESLLGIKDEVVREMFAKGVHWGHRTSRWHPNIKPFLYGVHHNVHVFDLNKTYDYFERALSYLRQSAAEGKVILFVGTRGLEKELVKALAGELGFPAVCEEWVGGTFTNFREILKRITYFRDAEIRVQSEESGKYTKKERNDFYKEYLRMGKKWEGLKNLQKLPDVVFLTDIKENALAVKEARHVGIPTVAITDSNTDPTLVDFPIPANDDAITSIQYILGKVKEAILKGKADNQQRLANNEQQAQKILNPKS